MGLNLNVTVIDLSFENPIHRMTFSDSSNDDCSNTYCSNAFEAYS